MRICSRTLSVAKLPSLDMTQLVSPDFLHISAKLIHASAVLDRSQSMYDVMNDWTSCQSGLRYPRHQYSTLSTSRFFLNNTRIALTPLTYQYGTDRTTEGVDL